MMDGAGTAAAPGGAFSPSRQSVMVRRTRLLRPRLAADLVPRPHLVTRLNRGLSRRLTLVVTPAGFGKTTLLCEWLAQCPYPATWLSLDEASDDLTSFVAHLVGAIRTVAPDIGASTVSALDLPQPTARLLAVILQDELLDLTDDLAIVIDDYHSVADARVHEFVSTLLELLPPEIHIAVASRVDPPLPVARLRERDQVTELRASDLRFTTAETAAFFNRSAGINLDASTAEHLEERTEGWVAGLRLAALTMQQGDEDAATVPTAFEGRQLLGVIEFLSQEVLERQTGEVRDFLLQTSLVERLCPSLCDALLGRATGGAASALMLERIQRANLYLTPLGDNSDWYRYHPLFRDLLRHRLRTLHGEGAVVALHTRAADWFSDQGMVDDAIDHALAAGQVDAAAQIVERHARDTSHGRLVPATEAWLRRIPEQVRERYPGLLIAELWIATIRRRTAARAHIAQLLSAWLHHRAEVPDDTPVRDVRGALLAYRSMELVNRGDGAGAAAATAEALRLLPEVDRHGRGQMLFFLALAEQLNGHATSATRRLEAMITAGSHEFEAYPTWILYALTVIRLQAGDIAAGKRAAAELAQIAARVQHQPHLSWGEYWQGVAAYETNAIDEAIEHFARVVDAPDYANGSALRESTFGLCLAYGALGRWADADATLGRLYDFLRDTANPDERPRLTSFEARLALRRGDVERAIAVLGAEPPERSVFLLSFTNHPALTRAQVLLAAGTESTLDEAEALINSLLADARNAHYTRRVIEILGLKALASWTRHQHDQAEATMEEALTLGEPGGFLRTFVDLGPAMAALLRQFGRRAPPEAYAARILDAFPSPEPAAAARRIALASPGSKVRSRLAEDLTEPLTDRELDVLALLQQRLSNKEIAAVLSIAPLTVKVHASNIYSKLGANGRRQAVRTAEARGLLVGPASA